MMTPNLRCFFRPAAWAPALLLALGLSVSVADGQTASAAAGDPVTVADSDAVFTLDNGIVTARVNKRSGDLVSLQYRGVETLAFNSGHSGGYWSHDTLGGEKTLTRVTVDPSANGGDRGEISVKGISGGRKMGHGPGSKPGGDFAADIEIRYALGRGDSGVYTYCTFEHLPGYPAAVMTEARYCAKLADMFDWMTLDAQRSMPYPRDLHEGDKYIYTAVQYDHPVYGWSSTAQHVGFWLVNPSAEYLSGGPTKPEFLCHRDTTPVAAPCIHNYWRSSHYGGAGVEVGRDEHWTKVIGPFFLYVNSGGDPASLWRDAQAQAVRETAKWPYAWVAGVDYPRAAERATVNGRLALDDPQAPSAKLPHLLVGLAAPAFIAPVPRPGVKAPREVTWQTDAKHYEFWVRGDDEGNFSIPNVRPGRYTLSAFADGVLGEYARADVVVESGQPLDLGTLDWKPLRRGRQLWDIGIPNRSGSEFFKGDTFTQMDISLQYPKFFPHDVNYTVGQSDFRRDWFFQQVPHCDDPAAKVAPYRGIVGHGRATPYAIAFRLAAAPRGKATLRLAICGTGTKEIDVSVNGQPAGKASDLVGDGVITRHQIQGIWYEREVAFDASLMKAGANVLQLTVPGGPINDGVIYDYVRLELDDAAPAVAALAP